MRAQRSKGFGAVQRDATAEAWLAAARALLRDPTSAAAHAWLAGVPPLPSGTWPQAPASLVARPAPEPPAAWHARALRSEAGGGRDRLALAWHARWLAYALAPEDPASRPKVSVVIPVYNRRRMVVEAVVSALEQDWPATEVVVLDDASTDDPAGALAPWRDRIVFHRLERNGGVSVARNAALALATGEIVQFLDSDNLLLPGALSRKVAAFAHVPDALLCYSNIERAQASGVPDPWVPLGSPTCPTQDPRVGLIITYACLTSTLMVARHLMQRVGNFDERLRRHEDRLLLQRFGLRNAKTVVVDAPLTLWRYGEGSLFRAPDDEAAGTYAGLLFLEELLPDPRQWDLAALALRLCLGDGQWAIANRNPTPELLAQTERVGAWLDGFAAGLHLPELSPQPLAAELLGQIERDGGGIAGPVAARFATALQAMLRSRPPGPADLAVWRRSHNPPANRAAFLAIFEALSSDLRRGSAWVPLGTLDERPFRSLPHRHRRGWKRIAQTARILGERPARTLARLRG